MLRLSTTSLPWFAIKTALFYIFAAFISSRTWHHINNRVKWCISLSLECDKSRMYLSLLQILSFYILTRHFIFLLLSSFELFHLHFAFALHKFNLCHYIFHWCLFLFDLFQFFVVLQLFFLIELVYYFSQAKMFSN